MDRDILHIDMNSCFASIELVYHPELRGRPVAVGGDAELRHGIILAKNQEAKKYGIKTGEALWQAQAKCPELVILKPRHELYLRYSRMARDIYAEYTARIEPFGIDEAWLDVTDSAGRFGGAPALAELLRRRVKEELGVTVSVGVSYNKIFAKLGSDYKKPDAVTVITRDNYKDIVWPLPAEELLYVGPATRRKLYDRSVYTIGQLAAAEPAALSSWLGKMGLILGCFARGEDTAPVALMGCEGAVKSIGNSTTAPRDLVTYQDVSIVFHMLCESVAERLREGGFTARGVQISLRDSGLFWFERQLKLPQPTCTSDVLHESAMKLVRANWHFQKPLRSVGIRATDLLDAARPEQLTFFADAAAREKRERLERSIDEIRSRFGHYAICRAVTASDPSLANIDPREDHTVHPVGFFKAV